MDEQLVCHLCKGNIFGSDRNQQISNLVLHLRVTHGEDVSPIYYDGRVRGYLTRIEARPRSGDGTPENPFTIPEWQCSEHGHYNPPLACAKCRPDLYLESTIDPELETLVSCMRTSAQDTLNALHRNGWKIVRA